jgi:hypothetical protein
VIEETSQEGDIDSDPDLSNHPATYHISKDRPKEMCASTIAKLQSSGVANNVVRSVVESTEDYVNELHTSLREQVLSVVPPNIPSRRSVE